MGWLGVECSGYEWVHTQTHSGAECLLSHAHGARAHTGVSGDRILHLGLSWPQEPRAGVTSMSGLYVTLPD